GSSMSNSGSGTTCAVIGAGLGGSALVAAMALHGYRMRLHDLDDTRLKDIRDRGGIEVYSEGYTPSAIKVLESVSAARLAVARELGVRLPSIHEWLLRTYQLGGATLAETFRRLTLEPTGPYQWTPTPKAMEHKYVTEDVPSGLVAMSALG